jgi:hypothetical protein
MILNLKRLNPVIATIIFIATLILPLEKKTEFCRHSASLSAFVKLRKAAISFIMSACLSVHMEQLASHLKDFNAL